MTWRERVAGALFGDVIERRVAQAVKVVDDEFWTQIAGGRSGTLDRDWHEHRENLDDALEAWRVNPLARRIVSLCTDYVIGSGIRVKADSEQVQHLVDEFWKLNQMERRVYSWCDELTRSGELFVVLRTDQVSGASFVRAIAASQISQVVTDKDDLERELRYGEIVKGEFEPRWWPSAVGEPSAEQVMLHYAINRPVGCVRGDGDLTPILPWLKRYKDWLENRVRLNKYKTAFLWDVTVTARPGRGDVVRKKRMRYKTAPEPGSIVVHDDGEQWNAVSPKLEAWDAKEDGKAIRLAIAAGAGIPLHFLAEGESATKATAQEMGDPTYRHYLGRQLYFGWLVRDLLATALARAKAAGRGVGSYELACQFPDVTKADNMEMAQSALMICRALDTMARWEWIDKRSAIEIAMKFAGELVDVEQLFKRLETDGPTPMTDAVLGAGAAAGGLGRPVGSVEGSGVAPLGAGRYAEPPE